MSTITLQEVQRDPVGFFQRIEAGETLVVVRGDQPVAEVKPVIAPVGGFRPFGLCAGRITVPTNFDDPLPSHFLKEFEGQ